MQMFLFSSPRARSLRAVFPAGEHFDPNTAQFLARHLHHPILDHYWQTESGWPIVANPTGMRVRRLSNAASLLFQYCVAFCLTACARLCVLWRILIVVVCFQGAVWGDSHTGDTLPDNFGFSLECAL